MTVLINKWDGRKFENEVSCSVCGKTTSVKEIYDPISNVLFRQCKSCLLAMVAEIDQAVLIAASDGKVKGDDACNECDGLGKINAWLHEGVQVIGCPTCKGMGRKNPVRKEGS